MIKIDFTIEKDGMTFSDAIVLPDDHGLSDADIERMVKDAEANKEADQKRREVIDARNSADGMIASVEKSLEEAGDKVTAELKAEVEQAITDLKAVIDNDDAELIKANTNALAQASMKIGQVLYEASQAEATTETPDEAAA